IGIVKELKDDSHAEEVKQMLNDALSVSINLLDSTIMDLNSILKVKNIIDERKEKIVFSELIENIHHSIKNLMNKEKATIKVDFQEINEHVTLKSYMQSIFFNLISNSIKYRQADIAPLITIKSSLHNGNLVLTYQDNGMGIDMAKKGDQVFGLYKRFHNHVEGKGMGLFMVKTHVETLGGKIAISSEVNKGTTFRLFFPLINLSND
uniref:sensor histidine kinase n=1 Tax=Pedobacter sp. TaxID=1411316 RepID=UPI003D7F32FD